MYEVDFHKYTLNNALEQLNITIKFAKNSKFKVIALIVGYGSSGKSHKIKTNFITILEEYKQNKLIKDYLKGEDLDIFNKKYQEFKYKEALKEAKYNKGIIYVIL